MIKIFSANLQLNMASRILVLPRYPNGLACEHVNITIPNVYVVLCRSTPSSTISSVLLSSSPVLQRISNTHVERQVKVCVYMYTSWAPAVPGVVLSRERTRDHDMARYFMGAAFLYPTGTCVLES
jgi:hypothetical protein